MKDQPSKPEREPTGWDRFEKAVDAALHTPAKHKPPKEKPPAGFTGGSGSSDPGR